MMEKKKKRYEKELRSNRIQSLGTVGHVALRHFGYLTSDWGISPTAQLDPKSLAAFHQDELAPWYMKVANQAILKCGKEEGEEEAKDAKQHNHHPKKKKLWNSALNKVVSSVSQSSNEVVNSLMSALSQEKDLLPTVIKPLVPQTHSKLYNSLLLQDKEEEEEEEEESVSMNSLTPPMLHFQQDPKHASSSSSQAQGQPSSSSSSSSLSSSSSSSSSLSYSLSSKPPLSHHNYRYGEGEEMAPFESSNHQSLLSVYINSELTLNLTRPIGDGLAKFTPEEVVIVTTYM
jgi:hypothetical protein